MRSIQENMIQSVDRFKGISPITIQKIHSKQKIVHPYTILVLKSNCTQIDKKYIK